MSGQGATAAAFEDIPATALDVPDAANSPVNRITEYTLKQLGQNLNMRFNQYKADRQLAEHRWLRNQRQYLGVYDPEVEKELQPNRSRAYPKVTRIKCISVLSRLMNLMFQGNTRNWVLEAAPWPDMSIDDVKAAVKKAQADDQAAGNQPAQITGDYVKAAVKRACADRAKVLSDLIDDQLQELGGEQTCDYVALNRKALASGLLYGLGVLHGPFMRECQMIYWDESGELPIPKRIKAMKPMFEFLTVWDFYPDMAAKTFAQSDGFFVRKVMSRHAVRELANRPDFLGDAIKRFLGMFPNGNWRPQWYESELRAMGVKANVNDMKPESTKYEVLVWHGPITGHFLQMAGADVPEDKLGDDLDAEVWTLDGIVIKAIINPWRTLGVDMPQVHTYLYDEDDTSAIGFGLPVAVRDSQMGVSAATRMLMDNASVVCGPNIEVNMDLMRPDQDLSAISAYKVWYREGEDITAQWPAVRNVTIDAHIDSLLKIIDFFMKMADMETFVGPATGGDMSQAPSEPFRTASGASQLMGNAALPFKDMIRAFDSFTQSIIYAMVLFNKRFNPKLAPDGDYNVIALGATSLMAKEVRGAMADDLATSLTPDEKLYVDARKLLKARVTARDMEDIMVDDVEAKRREANQAQSSQQDQDQKNKEFEATVRQILSQAFKNITQGQKNTAAADAQSVQSALDLLERGLSNGIISGGAGPGAPPSPGGGPIGPGAPGAAGAPALPPGGPAGGIGGGAAAGLPGAPGGM